MTIRHLPTAKASLFGLGALVAAGLALAAPAAHATQISPGPAVTGATSTVTNGSTVNVAATGTSALALYIGASAADEDTLSLFGMTLFDNRTSASGDTATLSPLTVGEVLPFTLNNLTTSTSFVSGTAYTNTDAGMFHPVYHFAYFDFADEAAYNAVFGALVPMTSAANAVILANGGYSAFIFAGAEDLQQANLDDWNDVIYAYHNVVSVPVPEPMSLALLGAGIAGLGVIRRRRG